jgi:hypothetical protein
MRATICTRAAGLALAAVAATCLFAGVSFAAVGGGFSVRPAHSSPSDPATRAYFKPVVVRGGSFSDSVIVANPGPSPVQLLTYAVDGLTGQTTGTVYANRRDHVRKAGAWVRMASHRITVPAHRQVSLAFTVHVPGGAQPGDHVAGIAFENVQHPTSGGRLRIIEVIREVIGVQIRVPGRASPRLVLGSLALRALPGTKLPSVVVGIGNRGLALCKPRLAVLLRGPGGRLRRIVRALDTVLPGDRVAYPLPWPVTLPSGDYSARAAASCKGVGARRASALHLGKTLSAGHDPGAVKRSGAPGSLTWWLLAAVALGGIGAGVALSRIRSTGGRRAR